MNRSALINVMAQTVERVGRRLVRDFGEVENLQVSRKGPGDFVSKADFRAEQALRDSLAKARPGYGFLLEESGEIAGTDRSHRWIIDPLDGTTNFLHGIPHFAISVGLERDGKLVAGVIYNPISAELFWAERGSGAYCNRQRLRVSARKEMTDALIGTGIPHADKPDQAGYLQKLARQMPQVSGIRRMGTASLDLAYVAAGRFDGYWEYGIHPWDMAAGILLVKEAGGRISEPDFGENYLQSGDIVATNSALHAQLCNLLVS